MYKKWLYCYIITLLFYAIAILLSYNITILPYCYIACLGFLSSKFCTWLCKASIADVGLAAEQEPGGNMLYSMQRCGIIWGYAGIMEKKMETTIVYRVYIGVR